MSIYTTPLQFGYFFSLLMAVVYVVRGMSEERVSDRFMSLVMLLLALELQDYTFGFAGINFLWNQLNGFPRGVSLLFGPAVYFYLRSQTNRNFYLARKHLWHLLPWTVFFIWGITIFVQGPIRVQQYQQSTLSVVMAYLYTLLLWLSYSYYFYRSLRLYRDYRSWSQQVFSDVDIISFTWFRNFIYVMIFWVFCKELLSMVDLLLDLTFYQDWWWNLVLVVVAVYVGLAGYAQKQPADIDFEPADTVGNASRSDADLEEQQQVAIRLARMMEEERLFLQPELSLRILARHLKINPTLLSATINRQFACNFNDYINGWRVQAFKERFHQPDSHQYTLLSLAYECGFNSKATFNRAFKKASGMTPGQYARTFQDGAG